MSTRFLEVSTLTAAQPLDETVFAHEVAFSQRDVPSAAADRHGDTDEDASSDGEQQQHIVEDGLNTTGVREMISSLMFA